MVNICDRWNKDQTDNLQYAFFNGMGLESWENVWGIWNGINPRDAEAIRRVAAIERAFAPFLVTPDWEPLYPMRHYGVFASHWPLRRSKPSGPSSTATPTPSPARRSTCPPPPACATSTSITASNCTPPSTAKPPPSPSTIEANGYGAILATPAAPDAAIADPHATHGRPHRQAALRLLPRIAPSCPRPSSTSPPPQPASEAPAGMIRIPGGPFDFKVRGTEIEGGDIVRRRRPVPLGRLPAPLPRARPHRRPLLHRQVPRHQRPVQAISRGHPLRPARPHPLSPRLEGRNLPRRLGQPARHLGLA